MEFASVIVFGRASLVNDQAEARHGLQLLLDKYFAQLHPGSDYRPITDDELARTQVYRIEIDEWSGKRKQVAADFPGAFDYARARKLALLSHIQRAVLCPASRALRQALHSPQKDSSGILCA